MYHQTVYEAMKSRMWKNMSTLMVNMSRDMFTKISQRIWSRWKAFTMIKNVHKAKLDTTLRANFSSVAPFYHRCYTQVKCWLRRRRKNSDWLRYRVLWKDTRKDHSENLYDDVTIKLSSDSGQYRKEGWDQEQNGNHIVAINNRITEL